MGKKKKVKKKKPESEAHRMLTRAHRKSPKELWFCPHALLTVAFVPHATDRDAAERDVRGHCFRQAHSLWDLCEGPVAYDRHEEE